MLLFYQALLFLAGILSMVFGLLTVFRPRAVKQLNLPLEEVLASLNSSIRLERLYYRYHRITGPLTFLGGAILCLAAWLLAIAGDTGETWLILQQVLLITFALFGPVIIVLGLVITIRPSVLKPLEMRANLVITWEMVRNLVLRFRLSVVDGTLKYPRVFGSLATLAGMAMLFLALASL